MFACFASVPVQVFTEEITSSLVYLFKVCDVGADFRTVLHIFSELDIEPYIDSKSSLANVHMYIMNERNYYRFFFNI